MNPEALLAGFFLYLGLLFLLARLGEERGGRLFQSPWTYTLSLGIYATAWTFFGSAGWAATSGPLFLTIYLGPPWPWPFGPFSTCAFCAWPGPTASPPGPTSSTCATAGTPSWGRWPRGFSS